MTSVVNIRKAELKKQGYRDLEHWIEDENHVYIGRKNPYVKGTHSSIWRNKFTVKMHGREGCIEQYEKYVRGRKDLMSQLPSLKGKVLGCWCKPEGCHGDVLVKLLGELEKST